MQTTQSTSQQPGPTGNFQRAFNEIQARQDSARPDQDTGLTPGQTAVKEYGEVNGKTITITLTGEEGGGASASIAFDGKNIKTIDAANVVAELPQLIEALDDKNEIRSVDDRSNQLCGVLEFQLGYADHGCASAEFSARCNFAAAGLQPEMREVTLFHKQHHPTIEGSKFEGTYEAPCVVVIGSGANKEVFCIDGNNASMLANEMLANEMTNAGGNIGDLVAVLRKDGGVPLRLSNSDGAEPSRECPIKGTSFFSSTSTPESSNDVNVDIDVVKNKSGQYVVTLAAENGYTMTVVSDFDPREYIEEIRAIDKKLSVENLAEMLADIMDDSVDRSYELVIYNHDTVAEPDPIVEFSIRPDGITQKWGERVEVDFATAAERTNYRCGALAEIASRWLLSDSSGSDQSGQMQADLNDHKVITIADAERWQIAPTTASPKVVLDIIAINFDPGTYTLSFKVAGTDQVFRGTFTDPRLANNLEDGAKRDYVIAALAAVHDRSSGNADQIIAELAKSATSVDRAHFKKDGVQISARGNVLEWSTPKSVEDNAAKMLEYGSQSHSSAIPQEVFNEIATKNLSSSATEQIMGALPAGVSDYSLQIKRNLGSGASGHSSMKVSYGQLHDQYKVALTDPTHQYNSKDDEITFPVRSTTAKGLIEGLRDAFEKDVSKGAPLNERTIAAFLDDCVADAETMKVAIAVNSDRVIEVNKTDTSSTIKVQNNLGEVLSEAKVENAHVHETLAAIVPLLRTASGSTAHGTDTVERALLRHFNDNPSHVNELLVNGGTPGRSLKLGSTPTGATHTITGELRSGSVLVEWEKSTPLLYSEKDTNTLLNALLSGNGKVNDAKLFLCAVDAFDGADIKQIKAGTMKDVVSADPNGGAVIEFGSLKTTITATAAGGTTPMTPQEILQKLGKDIVLSLGERSVDDFHKKIVERSVNTLLANDRDRVTIGVTNGSNVDSVSVDRNSSDGAIFNLVCDHGSGGKIHGTYTIDKLATGGFPVKDVSTHLGLAYKATRNGDAIDKYLTELSTTKALTSAVDLSVERSKGLFAVNDGTAYTLAVQTIPQNTRVEARYNTGTTSVTEQANTIAEALRAIQTSVQRQRPGRPDPGVTADDIDRLFRNKDGETLSLRPDYAPGGYSSIQLESHDDGTLTLKLDGGLQRIRVTQAAEVALRDALKKEICERSDAQHDKGLGALLSFTASEGVLEVQLATTMASVEVNGYERIVEVSRKDANSAMEITMFREGHQRVFSGQLNPEQLTGQKPDHRMVIKDLADSRSYSKTQSDSFSYDANLVSVLCNHKFILQNADLVIKAGKVKGTQVYGDTFVRIERAKGSNVSTLMISHAGHDITAPASSEKFRKLTTTTEYAQLNEAFSRQGEDNKLSILQVRNTGTNVAFEAILERIAQQGKEDPDRESAATMLANITAHNRGFASQSDGPVKIDQIWFARFAPPQVNSNALVQPDRMVKNEEVYIIPDQKEFQVFINGDLDADRWGLPNTPPGANYKVKDLFTQGPNSLRDSLGLEGLDEQGDSRKSGFMFAMSGDSGEQKRVFTKLLEMANGGPEEAALEREMLWRGCTPIRFVMGIQNNLTYNDRGLRAATDPQGLISDIGIVEYKMRATGELECNLIPIGYRPPGRQSSIVGHPNTIANAQVAGRIHKDRVRLLKPADGIKSSSDPRAFIKNTINEISNLNERVDQSDPGAGPRIYEKLISSVVFQLSEETFCVGKNVSGDHRQKNGTVLNYNVGSEIEKITIREQVGSSNYFEAVLDIRVDQQSGPPVTKQILMRHEGALDLVDFRKAIFDEINLKEDKKLARLMSRMVKQRWTFQEIGEGVNVRIHHSLTKPEEVKSSLALLNTPESADRLKGSFSMYNNGMDFVKVALDPDPALSTGVGLYNHRVYRHHFETNTHLINQPNAKVVDSYISFQQAYSEPSAAIYDGFSTFVDNNCDSLGNRKGGSNKGGYARRHMVAAPETTLNHRMMNAVNEGLKLEARNATFSLSTSGINEKGLDFSNIDVQNSIVAISYVGFGNSEKLKPDFFNEFLSALCDPYKTISGSTYEMKNNSVDVDLEAVPANFHLSGHRIDNLDFKTGKDGNVLYNLCLSNCLIDKLRIGHGGNLGQCTGLNVTGCTVNTFVLNLNGGAGFDSSNRLYRNHIGRISLSASTISADFRATIFNSIEIKGCDINRPMTWEEREKILPLIQIRWSKDCFRPASGQLLARRNLRLMSDPIGSWWELYVDRRQEAQWGNVDRGRIAEVADGLHNRTAKRREDDSSSYLFGLKPGTNDYGLEFRLTEDDTSKAYSKAYRLGMFGVRPDKVYVELITVPPDWCSGLPNRFEVNADVVLRGIPALGTAMRKYEERVAAANHIVLIARRQQEIQEAEAEARPVVEAILGGFHAHGYAAMYKG